MDLYAPQRWTWAQVDVRFGAQIPAAELVQSVHLIGFVEAEAARVVLCRDTASRWFLPGGTREPGESIDGCLDRELSEEAGAVLAGPVTWLGAHVGRGYLDRPYRPHLPHPVKAWLWGTAAVRLTSPPTNPPLGEQICEVRAMPFAEAQELLAGRAEWYRELLELALRALAVGER